MLIFGILKDIFVSIVVFVGSRILGFRGWYGNIVVVLVSKARKG